MPLLNQPFSKWAQANIGVSIHLQEDFCVCSLPTKLVNIFCVVCRMPVGIINLGIPQCPFLHFAKSGVQVTSASGKSRLASVGRIFKFRDTKSPQTVDTQRLSAYGIYTVCGFWSEWLDSNYRDYLLSIQIHSLKPLFATVSGCPLRHPSTFTTIKNQALKGKIREKGKTKPPSQMHLPAFPFPLKRPLLKMHFQKLSFLYPVWAPEWSPPRPPPDTVKWYRGLVLCSASRFGFSAERPASQCWHSISVSTDTV